MNTGWDAWRGFTSSRGQALHKENAKKTKGIIYISFCRVEASSQSTSDSPTTCPRILLSGPAGSEIYQEMLVKVLAENFEAKLMIVDSLLLPGGSPAREAESSKEGSRRESSLCLQHKKLMMLIKQVDQH
ncbi:uncharacterized protein LOC108861977 isoform X1 [Raphanus sativus]|uniref:Uncharacterized protein LOC108861977 isoform X1 n=1 Tax=Raphanus sativus TaxID=3726 RepID=A0A6J0P609_RAPSA|nr:uncharacterized protein LOC108861977 isoform X1 [Raphanus sativus]XP_018491484.1 uncharacterized protein LOC108861977 isoform X1 [Raphanus sativus]